MMLVHREEFSGAEIDARIGGDVARRLLGHWRSARPDERTPPALADFEDALDADVQQWVATAIPLGDDFAFTSFGHAVKRHTTKTLLGNTTSWLGRSRRAIYLEPFRRVSRDNQPILAFHSAQASQTVNVWQRLILPLTLGDDGRMILVHFHPAGYFRDMVVNVFDASADAIVGLAPVMDVTGTMVDARVLVSSPAASSLLGLAPERGRDDTLRKHVEDLFGIELWLLLQDLHETRDSSPVFFDVFDGREIKMSLSFPPHGFVLTIADITRRRSSGLVAAE